MGTDARHGLSWFVFLLLVNKHSALQPEICISFIEYETANYDFILRCNFTNAPNLTNITWSYPSIVYPAEAGRFHVETILDDVDNSHLTELGVLNFNDSIDEGEYFCIGEGGDDILFGGHFILNECEDISMDPAFVELASSTDDVNVEVAEDVLLLAVDLYDTYESSQFEQEELDVFVDIIETVATFNFTEKNQTIDILKPFLELSSETLSFTQLEEEDFASVIQSMETTFTNAAVSVLDKETDETIVISTPEAEVYIGTYTKTSESNDFIDFGLDEFTSNQDVNVKDENVNTLSVDISNVNEDDSLQFVVLLYSGTYGPDTNETKKADEDGQVETRTISSILTIRLIRNGNVMSVPVNFSLGHDIENISLVERDGKQASFKCSFIDESKEPIYWSSYGCATSTSLDKRRSDCECNHTTSFAVLMKVTDDDVVIDPLHESALSWIMYIGCGVSIVALSLALATFTYVGLTDRIKIHVCLCATLLLAESFMLVGLNLTEPPVLCTVIAVVLHFSFLSVFAWMLVEGIHMYVMIIRVFGSENIDFNYYFIVGWAFPIVVVGASVGANLDGYGNDNSCWLDVESGLIWAFVGPSILVILINFMILILVVRIIKRATNVNDDEITKAKTTIKGIVVLLPILGVTWIFGLFAIGSATLVFQYIFSIFNSLQGLFIFIFYCLMNSEVRSSFERKRKQHQLNNGDLNSTFDESRSGKSSKQSKVTAISASQLQSTDDKKDVISVTVSNNKNRSGTPNMADEGIDMNMPGGIDDENIE